MKLYLVGVWGLPGAWYTVSRGVGVLGLPGAWYTVSRGASLAASAATATLSAAS